MTVKICDSTGGGCDFVTADVADLGMTSVGHDTVDHDTRSTDAVAVAFYSEPNFEGICHSVRPEGQRGLRSDVVDKVSSVAVNHHCRQDVQLCEHENLEGQCVSFRSNKARLGATPLDDNRASSVAVPKGWDVRVYRDPDHRGLRASFPVDEERLGGVRFTKADLWHNFTRNDNSVPNDSASSITVSNDATCHGRFDPRCVGILPGL